jgi:hypothetical protein
MKEVITSFQLWVDDINFVTHHFGYGEAHHDGVGKVDLIEMWGYFLGREYAHRRYGPTRHSLTNLFINTYDPPITTPVFANSWYALNELTMFDYGHIPSGFLHDICDDNVYNRANSLLETATVGNFGDSIQMFSIATIYNLLDGSTTSANSLITKLASHIPTNYHGNNRANYDTLRHRYGY